MAQKLIVTEEEVQKRVQQIVEMDHPPREFISYTAYFYTDGRSPDIPFKEFVEKYVREKEME